jgi:hypothetical protein
MAVALARPLLAAADAAGRRLTFRVCSIDIETPFGLSLSKPSLLFFGSRRKGGPFDAACGVAQDRLRQAQPERMGDSI